jgi:hypothetical protein
MTKRPSSLRHLNIRVYFVIRRSSFVIHFIPHSLFFQPHPSVRIFSYKICCDLPEARLVASKFLKIVLGGTAALHAYRVWGAVIF